MWSQNLFSKKWVQIKITNFSELFLFETLREPEKWPSQWLAEHKPKKKVSLIVNASLEVLGGWTNKNNFCSRNFIWRKKSLLANFQYQ